jgi:pimeloyl-ACP methyl ester carboxylesterase
MDRIVPVLYGEAWQQRIAGSQHVTIADGGHLVNFEQPEKVADIAGNFLAGGE